MPLRGFARISGALAGFSGISPVLCPARAPGCGIAAWLVGFERAPRAPSGQINIMSYRLYYAPDNASLIIRLALEELGVAYETALVDRGTKAQRDPAYLALNPAGRIPTLETPQGVISETGAILLWLADTHGGLLPDTTAPDRGAALNWLFFVSNTLHPDVLQTFYTPRYGPEAAVPDIRRAMRRRILSHLDILETQAVPRCPNWICGPSPSAIDLYIAAILRWVVIYPGDVPGWFDPGLFPRLMDMCARLETRPSCARLALAEGMTAHPFTAPVPANPPEGRAL